MAKHSVSKNAYHQQQSERFKRKLLNIGSKIVFCLFEIELYLKTNADIHEHFLVHPRLRTLLKLRDEWVKLALETENGASHG